MENSKNIINSEQISSKNIVNGKKIVNPERVVPDHRMKLIFNKINNINLFVNYYECTDLIRKIEYDKCLLNNIGNKFIDNIFIISETNNLPDFADNIKVKIIHVDNRPTYNTIFKFANELTSDKDFNIISNSDIYFDDTIYNLCKYDLGGIVLALSRWDNIDGRFNLRKRVDSQDTWIFQGTIKLLSYDFNMGMPGCDNRILHEFHLNNYKIFNPSVSIKTFHIHSDEKRYHPENSVIPNPYKFCMYTDESVLKKHYRECVIVVALNIENQMSLVKSFLEFGIVFYCDWKNIRSVYGNDSLKNFLKRMVNNLKPKFLFLQLQTPGILDRLFIDNLDVNTVFNWSGDVRDPLPPWYVEMSNSKKVISLFTNLKDVDEIRIHGNKAEYLQIGYEEDQFDKYKNVGEFYSPDIVFLGSNYGDKFPLSKYRVEMVNLLSEKYKENFGVYGGNWNTMNYHDYPDKELMLYQNCKIAIGLSHFQLPMYSSDRMFRAMASGAFYLTHYYPGIEKEFIQGIHLDWWNNFDELIEKIDFYLVNDEIRKLISYQGYKLVTGQYKWSDRIKKLKMFL